jgi:hypothetical protein
MRNICYRFNYCSIKGSFIFSDTLDFYINDIYLLTYKTNLNNMVEFCMSMKNINNECKDYVS